MTQHMEVSPKNFIFIFIFISKWVDMYLKHVAL